MDEEMNDEAGPPAYSQSESESEESRPAARENRGEETRQLLTLEEEDEELPPYEEGDGQASALAEPPEGEPPAYSEAPN